MKEQNKERINARTARRNIVRQLDEFGVTQLAASRTLEALTNAIHDQGNQCITKSELDELMGKFRHDK